MDTFKLVNNLKSRGFTEAQAAGVVETVQQVDLDDLVTRSDLKAALHEIELRMTLRLGGLMVACVAFLTGIKYFG